MAATFGQITTAMTFVCGGASLLWTAWQFHRDQQHKAQERKAQIESEEKRRVRVEVQIEVHSETLRDHNETLRDHSERLLHLERK